jgi:Family of unknown function (DUF5990)
MEQVLKLNIVLEKPTIDVDFGLQKGSGNNYETIQIQESKGENLSFQAELRVKFSEDNTSVFLGKFAQGTPDERFIYIDIGTAAGQRNTIWSRRLKIPLRGITKEMIEKSVADAQFLIETRVLGVGKDGSPNCGTAKPFNGWKLIKVG